MIGAKSISSPGPPPATTLLARFDGPSRWEALAKVAEIFRVHVREASVRAPACVAASYGGSVMTWATVCDPTIAGTSSRASPW